MAELSNEELLNALPENAKPILEARLRMMEAMIQRTNRLKESNRRRQSEWYERNADKKKEYAKLHYHQKKQQKTISNSPPAISVPADV